MTRDPGPLCACGCYRDEHLAAVSHDWVQEYGECQTCSDCERFTTVNQDEADALQSSVAPV